MEPKVIEYLLYEPEDNGILWIRFNQPGRMDDQVGAAEKNGTMAEVSEYMGTGDNDPDIHVIVLTLIRLLSARRRHRSVASMHEARSYATPLRASYA